MLKRAGCENPNGQQGGKKGGVVEWEATGSGRGGTCSRFTLSVMFPKPNSQGNSDGHIDGNGHVPDFPRCWNPDSSLNRRKDGLWQWNGKEDSRAQR